MREREGKKDAHASQLSTLSVPNTGCSLLWVCNDQDSRTLTPKRPSQMRDLVNVRRIKTFCTHDLHQPSPPVVQDSGLLQMTSPSLLPPSLPSSVVTVTVVVTLMLSRDVVVTYTLFGARDAEQGAEEAKQRHAEPVTC